MSCLEALFPLEELFDWIIPEKRSVPEYPGAFTLPSHLAFALEKSKAVKKCDDWHSTGGKCIRDATTGHQKRRTELHYGLDGESMYVSKPLRDIRGELPDGQLAEVRASDVRDQPLSAVLARATLLGNRLLAPFVPQQPPPLPSPPVASLPNDDDTALLQDELDESTGEQSVDDDVPAPTSDESTESSGKQAADDDIPAPTQDVPTESRI